MRLQRMGLLAGACLLDAGCDIPTDPPIIEQRWIVPLDEVALEQNHILPTDVTIVDSLYEVNLAPVVATESLGPPSCYPSSCRPQG